MTAKKKTESAPIGMESFNVISKATAGVRMPLFLPDGTETDHFLVIKGSDSKAFSVAQGKFQREFAAFMKSVHEIDEIVAKKAELEIELVASLIKDWSFDQPCTKANVCKFLQDAPQIKEQVDKFADDRNNFFTKPPTN